MNDAIPDVDQPAAPAGDTRAMRAGHFAPVLMAAALVGFAAGDLTRYRYQALTVVTALAALAWFAAMLADRLRHEPARCARCAAATANPRAAVARWKPVLWLYHSRWFRTATIIALLAWCFSGSVSGRLVVPGGSWSYATALPLHVPAYILIAVLVLSVRKHQQLQPWCPRCHRDGGDER